MEQQCESLAYEIELKNEKISKLQTSLNEKTLQLEKEQGKERLWNFKLVNLIGDSFRNEKIGGNVICYILYV